MKTGIKVFDAMTTKPVTGKVDDTITNCAKTMKKYGVGSLLITDKKQVVGMITEKDFVYKVLAKGINPDDTLARDIMEKNLFTITPESDLYDAMVEMRNNEVRRLPVEEDGKIIGLLTDKDILKIEPQLFELFVEKMRIREEDSKPIADFGKYEEGLCESCGNWSYRLKDVEGSKICSNCTAN
ncbi:MAG: CBS domain-containing protein [Nanoarchaeota archaeon]|nr:CBS domain-containing protein [Nanoarchaeota archaeon]MBU1270055.1 CBS domain-containing protein [Nanoarchaeota archaeon]MBU1604255.1 CBS domain-containing protein [Nanoarchaeota archaeon]MBU2443791.1 CBS domain-containing protein [Nanoarchaeota archaeon]